MADDLHYVAGDNYLLDDLSGLKIRASRARIIPGGQTGQLAVAPERWEPQQPQDFVTGVEDDQIAELIRSRQQNEFTILGTYVVQPAAFRATSITVDDPTGFQAGYGLQIMLDQGTNFITALASISGSVFNLAEPLPGTVGGYYTPGNLFGAGADPLQNSVLALNNIGGFIFILDVAGHDILDFNVLG